MPPAARSANENKTYGTDVLRPDQLKECLLSAHSIDVAADKMKTDREAIEADRKQLDDQVSALKNVSSKDKRVVGYRASEKDFNTRVRAFNENIAKFKTDSEKFNTLCAGKKHYVSDFNDVIAQLPPDVRKQAMKK